MLAFLPAAPAAAQTLAGPLFGVGYTANAPRLLGGGSAWIVLPVFGGVGLYADAKFTTDPPSKNTEEFLPGRTAEEMDALYPDHLFRISDDSYRSFNAAVAKSLTREFILYVGGGWVERTHYEQFYDETEEFGRFGFYWVEDPPESATGANLLAGMLLRLGAHIRAQFGAETLPRGFTVGISLNYPAL